MEYNNYRSAANTSTEMSAQMFLKKFSQSSALKEVWRSKFEEAYEYTMPGRESF